VQRRDFLRTAGAAAAASSLGAPIVHARDKSEAKPPIIGEGEHRYECHHGWDEVPDHIHWFETHGTAVDRDGLIYITHRGGPDLPRAGSEAQDVVVVFDPDGKFVRSFGKAWHGGGHGIDIREEDGQEFLYLAMMMPVNLLVKTDLKGEVVWIKKKPDESHRYDDPGARFAPTNVAFHPGGGFFLADGYGSNLVHEYDKDAKYVRTFGGTGEGPGQFRTPHGIWLDDRKKDDAKVVVADRANARLQWFDLDGSQPETIVKEVSFPAHFDTRGDVLLVPDLHARVSLFDGDNRVIAHLGYDPEWTKTVLDGFKVRQQPETWVPGRFVHPHDACFDRDGNIFVAEWVATGRISKLRKVS
jgi:DNA-binding beta-propeller fold protein YncE